MLSALVPIVPKQSVPHQYLVVVSSIFISFSAPHCALTQWICLIACHNVRDVLCCSVPSQCLGCTVVAEEECVRNGRDMTSADALGGNLQLAFEDVTLTKLIGGGGFGQVNS